MAAGPVRGRPARQNRVLLYSEIQRYQRLDENIFRNGVDSKNGEASSNGQNRSECDGQTARLVAVYRLRHRERTQCAAEERICADAAAALPSCCRSLSVRRAAHARRGRQRTLQKHERPHASPARLSTSGRARWPFLPVEKGSGS